MSIVPQAKADAQEFLAKASSALGTIWTAAGVLKLIFGIRITLPLFPPLDLERVAAWPSVTVGLLLIFAGAWLRRSIPLRAIAMRRDSTLNVQCRI